MCSHMPCAICTTPIAGPAAIQREHAMDKPSVLGKRKLSSAIGNADESAGTASKGLAARKPRKRRRVTACSSLKGLGPDNARALPVALDEHPVPRAQAGVSRLGNDDRSAAVELDEDLLAGPALGLVLDRIARQAAAKGAE